LFCYSASCLFVESFGTEHSFGDSLMSLMDTRDTSGTVVGDRQCHLI